MFAVQMTLEHNVQSVGPVLETGIMNICQQKNSVTGNPKFIHSRYIGKI